MKYAADITLSVLNATWAFWYLRYRLPKTSWRGVQRLQRVIRTAGAWGTAQLVIFVLSGVALWMCSLLFFPWVIAWIGGELVCAGIRRSQEHRAQRHDLELGIPPRPRPMTFEGLFMRWFGLYIVYSMIFICVGLFATLSSNLTVTEAKSSSLVVGLAATGMAAALLHVILLKLRRDRQIRDHNTLVEGIESRIRAARGDITAEGR